jgi:hypothetical protein
MTPFDALEGRDRLAESWVAGNPGDGRYDESRRRLNKELEALILQAQIVIWRKDTWLASQEGWEVFVSQPAEELAEAPPQVWFFSEEWEIPKHPWCGLRDAHPELQPVSGAFFYPCRLVGRRVSQMNLLPFSWTRGPDPRHGNVYMVGAGDVRFDCNLGELFAPLAAGLEFLKLPFVGLEPGHFPRHVRRGAELKRRPPLPDVNTVVLRRPDRDDERSEGTAEREWSCSFIRCGHWQRHWWPKLKVHRPTYIAPQLRGDPDKPLHSPKGLVYDVKR